MYVLSLRKLAEPEGKPDAIAHSEDRTVLEKFISRSMSYPRWIEQDGKKVMSVFREESELAQYLPPYPGREDEGILDVGTVDERIASACELAKISVTQQVRSAWDEMLSNTIAM